MQVKEYAVRVFDARGLELDGILQRDYDARGVLGARCCDALNQRNACIGLCGIFAIVLAVSGPPRGGGLRGRLFWPRRGTRNGDFRETLQGFAAVRRFRMKLQKFFVTLGGQVRLAEIVFLDPCDGQQRIFAVLAGRVLVKQELISIHSRLEILGAEALAHFDVQLSDGCERRGHLRGVRRNQIDAAVAGNHLLVIAERALAGGLAFESRTKFFGAIILRLRGLFFCGR